MCISVRSVRKVEGTIKMILILDVSKEISEMCSSYVTIHNYAIIDSCKESH